MQLSEINIAIQIMKQADEEFTRASIKVNDIMKEQIIVMADSLEQTYRDNGVPITQISTDIGHILTNANLEKYVSLTYYVLPEKYKNASKDRYKKLEQKLMKTTVNETWEAMEALDITKLDPEYLVALSERSIEFTDQIQNYLKSIDKPYLSGNTTNNLTFNSDNEKYKFKKAEMGKPLVTPEEMTKDDIYKQSFDRLQKTLTRFVEATTETKDWFCKKYIPLTAEDCDELAGAIETFIEFWRTYFDAKYRMDHYEGFKAAINKVTKSSAAAAKETAVQTLWIHDKKGNPVFRCMTKEQLEAVYRWEFNYMMELINAYLRFPEIVHRINKSHGERGKADRQVALRETLSHFS